VLYQREFDDDMLSYQRESTTSSYLKAVNYRNIRSDTRKIAIMIFHGNFDKQRLFFNVQATVNTGNDFFPLQIVSSSKPLLFGHAYTS